MATDSKLLLTSDHSNRPDVKNVLGFLDYSIRELNEGDNLIITYSGHGGILQDKNYDEDDFQDETWCLYDRQLLDDELFARFSRFKAGVNIFVISDSCHSGSVTKGEAIVTEDPRAKRFVPREQLFETFQANRDIYEPLMRMPLVRNEDIAAAVLQLGACQDDEYAMEDGSNGLFTKTIMKILERNGDIGSYQELLVRSKRALNGIQKPNLICYGNNHQQLLKIKPFGSSGNPGRTFNLDFLGETGGLIVEAAGAHASLSGLKQFIISQTLAVPEKKDLTVYHCSCEPEEPGIYPWDHAYNQYQFLKNSGFPVSCVLPSRPQAAGTILNAALEEKAHTIEAEIKDLSTDEEDERRVSVFQKLFKELVKTKKGVGKATRTELDEVLTKMFSLETVQVIFRDDDLTDYRCMTSTELEIHLNDKQNYDSFISIIKNSIFSSDTLTVHL
ncbi:MAG: hypothetical protein EOO02_11245 [Chitinophagaceae bacterium]|nr:MAG: hypothetical protein EOO02_11245 [Chitinophagaceae bacterium]